MYPEYEVIVHGVRIHIDGVSSWKGLKGLTNAKDIADSFLRYGFHSIEVRDRFTGSIIYLMTIKDKEELNARIS